MNTSKRIMNILFVAALILALVPVGSGFAEGTPVVTVGYDAAASIKAEVQFKNFKGITGKEAYVSAINVDSEISNTEYDFTWNVPSNRSGPTFNPFILSYNANLLSLTVNETTGTLPVVVGDLGLLNYIKLTVENKAGGSQAHLVHFKVDGIATNPDSFSSSEGKNWNVTGMDLTNGFEITGDIKLSGTQPQDITNMIKIEVGYLPTPDLDSPLVLDVKVGLSSECPDAVCLNSDVTVTAVVSDTLTGGSPIISAEYNLNYGGWLPMEEIEGEFGVDVGLEVIATIKATELGNNTICVRGTDAPGNISDGMDCTDFNVHYDFTGFFDPLSPDISILNEAKAGQTIPTKWLLTDGPGTPITDPSSFMGIYSYPANCFDNSYDNESEVLEYSPGTSGLQDLGEGNWQYNWKTPKSYSGECRVFFVKFNSGQESVGVWFHFK